MYDLIVIGGGINGCGIARDAAGRSLSVCLVEKNDLASGTSSYSTKLIHGGLRYLETYDFNLVKESLREREILQKIAPHIVYPSEFRMPLLGSKRSKLILRLGLKLYDYLAGEGALPKSSYTDADSIFSRNPVLKDGMDGLFSYSDCITKDTRMVVENAISAAEHGAKIFSYTSCEDVKPEHDHWKVTVKSKFPEETVREIRAKMVINATGPWVGNESSEVFQKRYSSDHSVSLVKGSHLVTSRLYDGDHSYILQNDDGRIVFICPFENNYSLIGTTEVPYNGDPSDAKTDVDEKYYLLETVNRYLVKKLNLSHIIWEFSGIRALAGDANNVSKISRESIIDWRQYGDIWWCNIIGGKLTSYRLLAERLVNQIVDKLKIGSIPWTSDIPLPGGKPINYEAYLQRYYWVPEKILERWLDTYGFRTGLLLSNCSKLSDLGKAIAPGIYGRELNYVCGHEMVRSVDDFLFRRSKLFLSYNHNQQKAISNYIKEYCAQHHELNLVK